MPKDQYIDNNFLGGLNVDVSPEQLSNNELSVAKNIDINDKGGVVRRPGTSVFYEWTGAGEIKQIIKLPRKDGSLDLLAVIDDNGTYKLIDTSDNSEIEVLGNNTITYFIFMDDLYLLDEENFKKYDGLEVYGADDSDKYLKLDGISENFSEGGIVTSGNLRVPSSDVGKLSEGSAISGETSNAYAIIDKIDNKNLFITKISGYFQANENAISGEETVTVESIMQYKGKVNIKFIDENDFYIGVSEIETYSEGISLIGGYLNIPYAGWSISQEESAHAIITEIKDLSFNSLNTLKKCKYATKHDFSNRFFYSGNPDDNNALYFSEPNQPTFSKGVSVLYPSENEGPITGLEVIMGYLVVFFENAIWVYTGIDPAQDAQWKKIPTSHGSISNESICLTTQSMTTLANGGLYRINPNLLGLTDNMVPGEQFIIDISKDKVSSIIKDITDVSKVRAVFDSKNNKYLLYIGEGKILVYNEKLNAFTMYEGIDINDLVFLNDEVLIASDNKILKFDGSNTDSEAIIPVEIKTSTYDFGFPFEEKLIDRFMFNARIYQENIMGTVFSVDSGNYFDFEEDLVPNLIPNQGHPKGWFVEFLSGDLAGQSLEIMFAGESSMTDNNFIGTDVVEAEPANGDIFLVHAPDTSNINTKLIVDREEKFSENVEIKNNQLNIIRKPLRLKGDRFSLIMENDNMLNLEIYGIGFNYKKVNTNS